MRLLFRAGLAKRPGFSPRVVIGPGPAKGRNVDHDKGTLQSILSEISAEALTNIIGLPIDSARAAYIMDSVTVRSHEEFNDTITSFYLHLARHTRKLSDPANVNAASGDAIALLERTFSKKGGLQAALAEARTGVNGGLRFVLDMMTEQYKREEEEKHVNSILKTALDQKDFESKVDLMRALIQRLEPHLDPEILSQPAERFAEHYEDIIKAYLQSMDRLNSIMRSL